MPHLLFTIKKYVTLFLLSFVLTINFAQSAEISHRPITVTLPSFAPFLNENPQSQCQGVITAIVDELMQSLQTPYEIKPLPYARVLRHLYSGEIDMALIFKNELVKQHVSYVGPVASSPIIVISNDAKPISNYDKLYSYDNIAIIRNAQYTEQFDSDTSLKKVRVNNYQQAIRMLNAGRVNAVVGSKTGIEFAIHQLGINNPKFTTGFPIGNKSWWFHIANKSTISKTFIQKLQNKVTTLYKDNKIETGYSEFINCINKM